MSVVMGDRHGQGMAAQESGVAKPATGKGSLDGLAQRLGALEESLTVVAGELGVSSVPKFKRLDPDSVYREAIRQAQQAVEPLRLALRNLDTRLDEIARAQAQIKREVAAARDSHARTESVAAIDAQVAALAARLDATVMPIDQNESKLEALNAAIENLSVRLDTIWQRLDAQASAEREAKSATPGETAAIQRVAALEHRIERLANTISAKALASPAGHDVATDEKLKAWQDRIAADVDRRLAQLAVLPAPAPQIDPTLIAAEVARQIQSLVKDAPAQSDPLPLMADGPIDRSRDINPLVMGATERAIVRLTHRLEKLEEWHQQARDDGRSKGRRGRLFES